MEVFISGSSWHGGLHLQVLLAHRSSSPGLHGVEVFISEAFKSSLKSAKQDFTLRVAGPPVHSPSPSCLALMIKSLAMLGVVDVVIIVEVDI